MIGSSEQPLLEYRIVVTVPQKLKNLSGGGSGPSAAGDLMSEFIGEASSATSRSDAFTGDGSTYELMVWSFPDERWYEEQWTLYQRGQYSALYGDPRLGY